MSILVVSLLLAWGSAASSRAAPAAAPTGQDAFQDWLVGHGLPPDSEPAADPDGDGLGNFREYAFSGVPTDPTSAPEPVGQVSGARLQVTFSRARSELNYLVEASDDLRSWSGIATNPGAPGQEVTCPDTINVGSTAARFLRVRVTTDAAVATPEFSVPGGSYDVTQIVVLTTATSGATLRYTTDGSAPSANNGIDYTGPLTVSASVTLRVIALLDGMPSSGVVEARYVITTGEVTNAAYLGIGVGSSLDWDRCRALADVMKLARDFLVPGTETLAKVDADGWPLEDADVVVWQGIDRMHGTYRLSFAGEAVIKTAWGDASVAGMTYDAATNTTTANLIYRSTDGSGLRLSFTGTKRTPGSGVGTGVSGVRLIRPRVPGGTATYDTEVFTDQFKASLASVRVLRFMDWLATNSNPQTTWDSRTRPTHASQQVGNPTTFPTGGWQGRGGCFEYAILLANEVGKDAWICVPVGATDDYVLKLAQICRYGSDGRDPYTGPQSNPVYPPLAEGLRLYVEFSNEIWNTNGHFGQSQKNHEDAIAEVAAGNSPLNYDGAAANDWEWAWRRITKRTIDVSNTFRAVFGDNAMGDRVRVVLMSQLGYADGPTLQQFKLAEEYYNNPARVSVPRPLNYYVYGAGGSAYYNPQNDSADLTLSTIWDSYTYDSGLWKSMLARDVDLVLAFGLKRIAYEGGPSLDITGRSESVKAASIADPRTTEEIAEHHTVWNQTAGDLLVYYQLSGDYQWGFLHDVYDTWTTPKMLGLARLGAATREESTYGTPLPATLSGSGQNAPPGWGGGGARYSYARHTWNCYVVRVMEARAYTLTVNVSEGTSGAKLDVYVDGAKLGTIAVPASGDAVSVITPSLARGTHGLRLVCAGGTFIVNTISVQ
ncbi:MAG: chitobiase/beta-hexosaminidase C-terminal domain-containing protein [Opitutaceae bacterium]|nr:chitobiase/beta-hexosaminidase C-terminal domain-containing protein [Opitutaceae bacterium]